MASSKTVGSEITIENIKSEEEDLESSPSSYEVLTYPADFTISSHVDKLNSGELKIEGFQRKYVWTQAQASKLIESFLLGLPVPPVFFYLEPKTNKMIVVDGQQRLRSLAYFYKGFFGEVKNGRTTVFRLVGLSKDSPFFEKTYSDLEAGNEQARRKLDDAVLRSFVIRQLKPEDDSSIYHIFERLNTGGTLLQGQEIRNCIYHGPFNDLLKDKLNKTSSWREVLGKKQPDKRFRDVELILRFLALHYNSAQYEKPMKQFLNTFMEKEKYATTARLAQFEKLFTDTVTRVQSTLGSKPFHIQKGLNVAAFDAVFTAFAKHIARKPTANLRNRYVKLTKDIGFRQTILAGTTDKEVVRQRLKIASRILFGA